jgi:hypothetical protein
VRGVGMIMPRLSLNLTYLSTRASVTTQCYNTHVR